MDDALTTYRQAHLNHRLLPTPTKPACSGAPRPAIAQPWPTWLPSNQRLVMSVAMRYFHSGMSGDLDLMDLVQYGNEGLLDAIRRWDHRRSDLALLHLCHLVGQGVIRRNILQRGSTISTHRPARANRSPRICRARSDLHVRLATARPGRRDRPSHGHQRGHRRGAAANHRPALSLDTENELGLTLADTIPL